MKAFSLLLTCVISINSLSLAASATEASQARQKQLIALIGTEDSRQLLSKLTNDELLQAQNELRNFAAALKEDLSSAVDRDENRLGYKLRNGGAISAATIIVLTVGGLIAENALTKNKAVFLDGAMGAFILLLGTAGTLASLVVSASGQVTVWLTPSEAKAVQDKIKSIESLSEAIDQKLKTK